MILPSLTSQYGWSFLEMRPPLSLRSLAYFTAGSERRATLGGARLRIRTWLGRGPRCGRLTFYLERAVAAEVDFGRLRPRPARRRLRRGLGALPIRILAPVIPK